MIWNHHDLKRVPQREIRYFRPVGGGSDNLKHERERRDDQSTNRQLEALHDRGPCEDNGRMLRPPQGVAPDAMTPAIATTPVIATG